MEPLLETAKGTIESLRTALAEKEGEIGRLRERIKGTWVNHEAAASEKWKKKALELRAENQRLRKDCRAQFNEKEFRKRGTMEGNKKAEVTFTLKLNAQEARLLRDMVQNPMCAPEDEMPELSKLRKDIFEALDPRA